ncbi:hypothetical protein T265_10600 [Opisthorchis viverrini]|uniref:Uncharacterized protein n=1 Tax=Opisthorchis viverrini TaxID=6198 RepID=A0A075A0M3_OPIVI|nr:hypothetical protein T265_10600 [Opisthorchis viverrini]KER20969.1 hypothetical protein T265_10600 [Opisthorchis viverrini]
MQATYDLTEENEKGYVGGGWCMRSALEDRINVTLLYLTTEGVISGSKPESVSFLLPVYNRKVDDVEDVDPECLSYAITRPLCAFIFVSYIPGGTQAHSIESKPLEKNNAHRTPSSRGERLNILLGTAIQLATGYLRSGLSAYNGKMNCEHGTPSASKVLQLQHTLGT